MVTMTTVYDVLPQRLIEEVKEELKKNEKMKEPDWALFVKSGAHKERPPQQNDFWYIRGAALLRKIYTKGPIGVSRLRTEYGGKKHRGSKPEEFRKGSGSITRKLLQQLEEAGYIKKVKGGREITPAGQKFLDNLAHKVSTTPKVEKPKKSEPKPESKPELKEEKLAEEPKEEKKEETLAEEKKEPEKKEEKPKNNLFL